MTEPRPSRLSHIDIGAEVAAVRDTDDIYRVYRPEWVTVYATETSDDSYDVVRKARDYLEDNLADRVQWTDLQVEAHTDCGERFWAYAKLRKPNLKGEFKTRAIAEAYVNRRHWDDAEIVARNSKRDHEIRAYGVKKLG